MRNNNYCPIKLCQRNLVMLNLYLNLVYIINLFIFVASKNKKEDEKKVFFIAEVD